jgi:hypothetical protein
MSLYGAWLSWLHFGSLLGPIISAGGIVLLIVAEHCASDRHRVRAVAFGFLGLVAAIVSANVVLVRTAETDASKVQAAASGNLARVQADATLKDAQAAYADAKAALAVAEVRRKTECATGRGKNCRDLERKEDAARGKVDDAGAKVADARTRIASLGVTEIVSPAAMTIAAFLGPWAETYQRVLQLAPAVWLELSSPLLLAYGFSPVARNPQPVAPAVPTSSRRRRGRRKRSLHQHGTNQHTCPTAIPTSSVGRGKAYDLARLQRDRPDLHKRVVAGELSANKAMIIAGFRKQKHLKLVSSQ